MYFDLFLPCDNLTLPNVPQHALEMLDMCWHAFSFLGIPLHYLAIIPSQLPLLFLGLGNQTKSWLNYKNLIKLQLLHLDYPLFTYELTIAHLKIIMYNFSLSNLTSYKL